MFIAMILFNKGDRFYNSYWTKEIKIMIAYCSRSWSGRKEGAMLHSW